MRHKNNLQGVKSIVSQICSRIARIIRSRKIFVIGLVTALLIIAFAVISFYSVGSCQKQASIRIVDETGGKDYKIRLQNVTYALVAILSTVSPDNRFG
jgi:uncharacterized membrane protein